MSVCDPAGTRSLPSQCGACDLAVPDQEVDPGAAVGDQAVQRRGARAERRRPGQHLLLEGPLVIIQQRPEDPRPAYGQHSSVGKILEIHQELPGRIRIVLIRQVVGF
jgi:hypothetical protein